ncbi:MAG: hypothetical protein LBL58_18165 [Tannerellaceae bacterium]|jgi:hypothetical protein|nr:hypothetical protein [Tannerellaceae bacterium]
MSKKEQKLVEELFQVEELEDRLEMKADITVSATVSSQGGGSASATVSWAF